MPVGLSLEVYSVRCVQDVSQPLTVTLRLATAPPVTLIRNKWLLIEIEGVIRTIANTQI